MSIENDPFKEILQGAYQKPANWDTICATLFGYLEPASRVGYLASEAVELVKRLGSSDTAPREAYDRAEAELSLFQSMHNLIANGMGDRALGYDGAVVDSGVKLRGLVEHGFFPDLPSTTPQSHFINYIDQLQAAFAGDVASHHFPGQEPLGGWLKR
jgi:hypothetical protein